MGWEDDGIFGPESVTWKVHVELVMWIAGIRALYLQSLHPRVMRGTYQNSELFDRKKAWRRFLRTAEFVTVRTYGATADVERVGRRVRAIHAALSGYDPETGERFRLDEPEHLLWVHCAEIDSYVNIAQRAGIFADDAEADRYVAESRSAAEVVGISFADAPSSRAELAAYFEEIRPRLRASNEARAGLLNSFVPPVPVKLTALRVAVPPVNVIALASLPRWARRMYGLPAVPTTDLAVTVQLRALRQASQLIRRTPTDELIAQTRARMSELTQPV